METVAVPLGTGRGQAAHQMTVWEGFRGKVSTRAGAVGSLPGGSAPSQWELRVRKSLSTEGEPLRVEGREVREV